MRAAAWLAIIQCLLRLTPGLCIAAAAAAAAAAATEREPTDLSFSPLSFSSSHTQQRARAWATGLTPAQPTQLPWNGAVGRGWAVRSPASCQACTRCSRWRWAPTMPWHWWRDESGSGHDCRVGCRVPCSAHHAQHTMLSTPCSAHHAPCSQRLPMYDKIGPARIVPACSLSTLSPCSSFFACILAHVVPYCAVPPSFAERFV